MNKRQSTVHEALSETEPKSMADLARATGLSRASVFRSLVSLQELGRARSEVIGKTQHFVAVPVAEDPVAETTVARAIRRAPALHTIWNNHAA